MTLLSPIGGDPATSQARSASLGVATANPFDASAVSWAEAAPATTEAWAGFYLVARVSTAVQAMVQVAKGAAGAETIIATLPLGLTYRGGRAMTYYCPLPIPAGTRLAVGGHCAAAASVVFQVIGVHASEFDTLPPFTVVESGPYQLSDYGNLFKTIDPQNGANTPSARVELSFTGGADDNNVLNGNGLANGYGWFGPVVGDGLTSAQTDNHRLWTLYSGPAGIEVPLFADYWQRVDAVENQSHTGVLAMRRGVDLPAGTRIAAAMQCSTASAGRRVGSIVMVGVR